MTTAATASPSSSRLCPNPCDHKNNGLENLIRIEPCGHEFHERFIRSQIGDNIRSCPTCLRSITGPDCLLSGAKPVPPENVPNKDGADLRAQHEDSASPAYVLFLMAVILGLDIAPAGAGRSAFISALGSLCLNCAGTSINPIKAAGGALAGSIITSIALDLAEPLCEKQSLYKSGNLGWLRIIGEVGTQALNSCLGSKMFNHSNAVTSAAAGTIGSVLLLLLSLRKAVAD